MEAIISHSNADFDGLASMVAAKKLYPQAHLFFPGPPEKAVKDFLNLYRDFIKVEIPSDPSKLHITKLVILDTRNPNRLGDFRHLVNNPQIEVHVYDHHPPSQEDIKGDLNVIETLGATTTIMMKLIIEKDIKLTPLEATLMTLGIYEETGSLLFTTTTSDDAKVVSHLLGRGANLNVVADFIYQFLNEEQRHVLNELIQSSEIFRVKGFNVLIARAKFDKYIDGLALVTHRLNDIERMDAVFVIAEMAGRIYMVARSIRAPLDVNKITRFFGGGGHSTAASAVIKHLSLFEVEKRLKNVLKSQVKPLVRASDIMSKPVQYLELKPGLTLNDAYEYMHRIGHFHLPIVQGNRLVGILDRRDVDKAKQHNYLNAPLEIYMSKPVMIAGPDMSVFQMQNLMMEKGIGCLPIVDKGNLIGIVTRTDVLEAVYKRDLAKDHRIDRPINHLKQLPQFLLDILKRAGRVGDKLKFPVYVVGGFVRDLLLGVENLDIDLVVEGDGIAYGEALARDLGGRVKVHEKFGTCIVILPDGMHIDVATSRTEFYTRPAALPEVMESTIKQDLYRRDFTINAMAIRLNRRFFGELLDFFGCRKDLRNGVVRVLHPMSFVEDPTRILRAIKFEQRYQFRMDQSTEKLIKNAISSNIFSNISAERVRNELIEILQEARPLPAIRRMDQLRILRLIHKDIALDSRMVEVIENTTAVLLQFDELLKKEKVKGWVLYFNALVMRLEPSQIEEIGTRFRVPRDIIDRVTIDKMKIHDIIKALSWQGLTLSQLYRTLEGLSLETILFIMARTKVRIARSRITQYLYQLMPIKPLVTGKMLIDWGMEPGPYFKEIISSLFDAQLDGRIKNVEEAKDYFERCLKSNSPT